ncbi:MAG: ABC transporter permease [Anaerolineae bacterium]|jgi:ABC-2 type transport system permease protein|nr:ABC transporter permease [Anaerolineae bacterium]
MKQIFPIILKDLQQYVKNVQMIVFMFIMPIAFTFLFGAVFADVGEDSGLQWTLAVANQDQGSTGGQLIEHLEADDSLSITLVSGTETELRAMVEADEYTAILLIPGNFTDFLTNGQTPELQVFTRGSEDVQSLLENSISFAAINPANLHAQANALAAQYEAQYGTDASEFREEVYERMVAASKIPVIETTYITKPGSEVNGYAGTAPGLIMQFAISGMIGIASIFVEERQNQTFARIRSTGTSGISYLLAHAIAFLALLAVQFGTLILFGQLVLKLRYFDQPLATLLIAGATIISFDLMGLFVAVFAKNQGQAIVYSLIAMFVFSALGGAWVPLEVMGPAFQVIGKFTPVAWGMDGFHEVLLRGGGVADVLTPALVLLGFGAFFFVLALFFYERRKEV